MVSSKSRISLCQYLELHENQIPELLLDKHGVNRELGRFYNNYFRVMAIKDALLSASQEQIINLLDEVIKTKGDLRSRISPCYRHDERWQDLARCLELDGYKIEDTGLIQIEPTIHGVEHQEDQLTKELRNSNISNSDEIITMLENSSKHFRDAKPDFNACLTNARIALETLAKSIAATHGLRADDQAELQKWGRILAFLRKSDFITEKEELGLSGVYSFISEGSHSPIIETDDEEMTRLGRNLSISMCYFLIKRYSSLRPKSNF